SGEAIKAQAVVLAVGITPNSDLAKQAGLATSYRGHIVTNPHYQTTDPNIYAVGDAIEINDYLTGKARSLALAGPAQWQARAAADHI
ncbi:NAD(P)/FAD-dependent oxidoreductase, partial [Aerococcus sp. UMB9870]|uniref:NAD(P)/FAD-dependent oxidoreductase n=1 Tax=Aerococcus sp. UMB9870 TaxID=3046351 RepID=UPI002550B09E